jgi:EAL domain-containing protein (putative c-di-GMP-specific phosphodiesterase class I)
LGQALQQQQFLLYYQPKVDLTDGRVIGVEALIRWQHPERGLLAPADFLPALQNSALEVTFGRWVLEQGIAQAAAGSRTACHGHQPQCQRQLPAAPGFLPICSRPCSSHPGAGPGPAGAGSTGIRRAGRHGRGLARDAAMPHLGVHFALDDFGTGYSSLTYLRKLPLDTLKIDQSFVMGMLDDADDLGIVASVIQLAAVFKRQVIAEGVETMAHGMALRKLGCSLVQGYGIAGRCRHKHCRTGYGRQQQAAWQQQLDQDPAI